MGCASSKEAVVATSNGEKKRKPAANPIDAALKNIVENTPDLVEQTKAFTSMVMTNVTGGVRTGAHHLKNVFAIPLEVDTKTYSPPVHPKSSSEAEFIRKAILQNFVFSNMTPKELSVLIKAFEKVRFPKGEHVIRQGDVGDYFYALVKGTVQFFVDGKVVGTAKSGHTFGELSLLYTSPRAASVVCLSDCDLFRVDQATFRFILQTQTVEADQEKRQLLRGVSFLSDLEEADLDKLVRVMTPRVFNRGDMIVRKGDDGDAFYVIQEGKILVKDIEVGGDTNYQNQTIGPGDYFGERALVTHEKRAANCVGASTGVALKIDRDTFEKVMGNLSRLVLKAADKRRLAAIKIIQESALAQPDLVSLASLVVDDHYRGSYVLMEEGILTEPALYIVRDGKVEITAKNGSKRMIGLGGYFGDEMLSFDADSYTGSGSGPKYRDPIMPAPFTVTVIEDATIGALTLEECRTIMDTTMMGKGKERKKREAQQRSMLEEQNLELDDLKRHKILGAGTFGQVWLVSRKNRSGEQRPYALKIQSKYELIQSSQAKGVVQEKNIMAQLHHPFILELVKTFQDKSRVFMLLRLVQGGELFSVMHQSDFDGIPEKSAKFYAAGILEGLSYMHRRHILYRDLKPENVMIDGDGYTVIVDLGFAKYVPTKTYTLCGTPLYIAPEVVLNRGHDKGADHFSFGVLIYEMIAGYTPFYKEGMDQITLFRAICNGQFKFPRKGVMSKDVEDLISRLLVTNPSQRLGSLARGSKDIFRHYWFSDMKWDKLKNKELRAPWKPKLKDVLDTSSFENWDHLEDKMKVKEPPLSASEQKIFDSF